MSVTWEQIAGVVAGSLGLALSLAAALHAILYKRDVRAAIGWTGLVVLVPVVGAILYFLLGINRIRRRASSLRTLRLASQIAPLVDADRGPLAVLLASSSPSVASLVRVGGKVTGLPLLAGNHVEPLVDGEAAFPAMLEAIAKARSSIALSTYIFDRDPVGTAFTEALAAAVRRGVEVRVLVDAMGLRYSFPAMDRTLRRSGVPVGRFLPTMLPWRMPYSNLRNHRKLLVADGRLAFTGGMNLRAGHLVASRTAHPIQDLHFRVHGPVVAQLLEVFVHDWHFVAGEQLEGEAWFPVLPPAGEALARAVADGPDEDFDKLRWVLLGALASAHHSIRVVTPYFLPDPGLITALNVAALRGVEVIVALPAVNNLALVQWAAMAQLWQILEKGCRVLLTPPPFDHSKLLLVDDDWAFIGSANWDPRSLRLNFELNLECYDRALVAALQAIFERKLEGAREATLAAVNARPLATQIRDGMARLVAPYL